MVVNLAATARYSRNDTFATARYSRNDTEKKRATEFATNREWESRRVGGDSNIQYAYQTREAREDVKVEAARLIH